VRLFLDANILFSAAWKEGGAAERLFRLADADFCTLMISRLAVEEARRNLKDKRAARLPEFEKLLTFLQVVPDPDSEALKIASAHGLPNKDVPILAAAIAARADVLVTGDRLHFGHLYGQRAGGVVVLTLSEALTLVAVD
jgi:predicted nucleic acid-binding protein